VRAALRPDVQVIDQSLERMIWRIVTKYAELAGTRPAVGPGLAYAVAEGPKPPRRARPSGGLSAQRRAAVTVR
jgi:hypothetical protein